WYDSLKSASANNIVLFPLRNGETLLGYMWAINFNSDKATRIKETLELTTFILGSEIANYLMLDRLKVLSSRDMLTGVLNRNEMNNLVDSLASDKESNKSVGVIFADLNGLKAVNDAEGHPAGDQLLKDAAKALCEVFDAKNIYRAGGDEFSIILTDITKQQLDKKVKMIREVSEKYDRVSFAIGAHVMSDNKNIRTALRLADEHMYEDKKAFYERFPDKKRVVRDLINMT
ncbi:MAG: GGDEF domain-containing protein, partial [Eubacterium sp.]|nr:GGDEF domain-containing protein [Eubacterium sp.]